MTWATAPLSRSGHEGESWSRNSLRLLTRPTVRLGLHNTQNKGAREALLSTPQLGQLRLRELDNLPKLRGSKARPRGLKPSRLEAGNSLLSGWALHVKGCVLLSGRGWAVGVSKGRTGALMEASWRWQRSAPPPGPHVTNAPAYTWGAESCSRLCARRRRFQAPTDSGEAGLWGVDACLVRFSLDAHGIGVARLSPEQKDKLLHASQGAAVAANSLLFLARGGKRSRPPRFVGEGLRFCTHLAALPRTCSLTLNKLLDSSAPQCCCLKNG